MRTRSDDDLRSEVETVEAIRLTGLPDEIVVGKSLGADDRLCRMLNHLGGQGIAVRFDGSEADTTAITVRLPDNRWFFDRLDSRRARLLLGRLLSSLLQERAGIAFREAGKKVEISTDAEMDFAAVLDRLLLRHENPAVRPRHSPLPMLSPADLQHHVATTVTRLLDAIVDETTGAIAAAAPPRRSNEANYWFFWMRDAGQIMIALDRLRRFSTDRTLGARIEATQEGYRNFVVGLVDQLGLGALGGSRQEMDGTPIEAYGNPQDDGPSITVLALTHMAHHRTGDHAASFLEAADSYLDYCTGIAQDGPHRLSYDSWEFIVGRVFNVRNLLRRALRAGAIAYEARPDAESQRRAALYRDHSHRVAQELSEFWDPHLGHLAAAKDIEIDALAELENLDVNIIGSALVAWDPTDDFLNLEHEWMTGTMRALEAAFHDDWAINRGWQAAGNKGFGMGRRPEDMNDGLLSTGGNPWVFATMWEAQYWFNMAERLERLEHHDRTVGGHSSYDCFELGEGALEFVRQWLHDGVVTEQIDGDTGDPTGAEWLGWATTELLATEVHRYELGTRLAPSSGDGSEERQQQRADELSP